MTFVDLGAHVGYHTVIAAERVGVSGTVIAVEPEPTNFALLRENLGSRGLSFVRTLRAAAWSTTGTVTLDVSTENSGDHRVSPDAHDRGLNVKAIVMDDVLAMETEVHVLKSDLQGRDHVAIKGTEKTIRRTRPTIILEFWPFGIRSLGDDPIDVAGYYGLLGYKATVVELPELGSDVEPGSLPDEADRHPQRFLTLLLTPR